MIPGTTPSTQPPPDPAPRLTGEISADARVLAECAAATDALLAGLPGRADRTAEQQRTAEAALVTAREVRRAFLARHVDEVYGLLTDAGSVRLRLPELLREAADRFPGLVPTEEQMRAEHARIQAARDGREVDQAVFCGAVLRSPAAGTHLIDTMLLPTSRALDLLEEFRRADRVDLGSVLVERRGHGAHVTIRNAHCLNAEDNRLMADLETAADLALLDDRVRVGVLRGAPVEHPRYAGRRVFSAGINLKDLRNGRISFVDFLLGRELGFINKLARGVLTRPERQVWAERTVQKPWVGAVDTFAIGGGMQILLVLDRVIAETDAYVSLPAAEEGIVPGLGNLRLTRRTGATLARQILLGGRRVRMTDPEAGLLCDEVVPAADMDEAVERAVRELGSPAVAANRSMLMLTEEPLDLFRGYLAEFAEVQVARAYSDDVMAKVERRWQQSRTRAERA
ncbi:(3,5-dihydroxyphenyl)acetyl-CoA 1,2-dioxygenase DpgC [Streptomyces sp. NPDC001941]|uniref:(3,5-dihydroxyphenyl)acetyl-CoA 1,2-dioxygenase DpgC n=1 Tax=Streptomyces sp. NPDC001941 TaxID=3154659 RepID=UPI003331643A